MPTVATVPSVRTDRRHLLLLGQLLQLVELLLGLDRAPFHIIHGLQSKGSVSEAKTARQRGRGRHAPGERSN